MSHRISIVENGETYDTLEDILPIDVRKLDILFIAKVPTPRAIEMGHYFQGNQGISFWNKLKQYGLLDVPNGEFEDDQLLNHNYGMIDIVKIPREYGEEPSGEEYRLGAKKACELIERHKPKVVIFVYKKVLDKILKYEFGIYDRSVYGFNDNLAHLWNTKVFVFPMPGTRVNKADIHRHMTELKNYLQE